MSRKEKLTRRLLNRPADMRPDELLTLLEMHGFKRTRTRGSHCICSDGTRSMTVPLNVKELKRPYLAEAIRLLGLEPANEPQD